MSRLLAELLLIQHFFHATHTILYFLKFLNEQFGCIVVMCFYQNIDDIQVRRSTM